MGEVDRAKRTVNEQSPESSQRRPCHLVIIISVIIEREGFTDYGPGREKPALREIMGSGRGLLSMTTIRVKVKCLIYYRLFTDWGD